MMRLMTNTSISMRMATLIRLINGIASMLKPGRAGFAYGKYLVSFADSARADKDKPYMDIKNGYTFA